MTVPWSGVPDPRWLSQSCMRMPSKLCQKHSGKLNKSEKLSLRCEMSFPFSRFSRLFHLCTDLTLGMKIPPITVGRVEDCNNHSFDTFRDLVNYVFAMFHVPEHHHGNFDSFFDLFDHVVVIDVFKSF